MPQLQVDQFTSNENDIYTVLLSEFFPKEKSIVILKSTNVDYSDRPEMLRQVLQNAQQKMPLLSENLKDNFLARNQESRTLEERFVENPNIYYMSNDRRHEIFADTKGWDKFRINYPDAYGLITLSKAGFEPSMNRALVYMSCQKNPLDGFAYYILLDQVNGKWRISDKFAAWYS